MRVHEQPIDKPTRAKPDWAMRKGEADRARRDREGLPRKRLVWRWIAVVLLLVVGAGYYAFRAAVAPEPGSVALAPVPQAETVMQVNAVEMAVPRPQTLQRTVRVIGTIAPARQAQLSAPVNGRIETVLVKPGDAVSAGDILAQIDVETLTLELRQARSNADATRAQLGLAEGQLERALQLIDRGVTTTSTLDEAQSIVAQLRAGVRRWRIRSQGRNCGWATRQCARPMTARSRPARPSRTPGAIPSGASWHSSAASSTGWGKATAGFCAGACGTGSPHWSSQ